MTAVVVAGSIIYGAASDGVIDAWFNGLNKGVCPARAINRFMGPPPWSPTVLTFPFPAPRLVIRHPGSATHATPMPLQKGYADMPPLMAKDEE